MKKLFIVSALLLSQAGVVMAQTKTAAKPAAPAAAISTIGKWNVDASHSNVKFTVTHLTVSEVEGTFKKFTGTVDAPNADFNNAKINFSVEIASINTDDDKRDTHLKSDDFFNAEKYPTMTFTSTSFKKIKGNIYSLEGDLTIRDVTKHVKFAVLYGGVVKDPWGNIKAGFKASTKISRKEFGLKWSALTEAGGAVVGDEVTVLLAVELGQQK